MFEFLYQYFVPLYFLDTCRYPDDPYDRHWWQLLSDPTRKNISTTLTVQPDYNYAVPSPVMQTAIEAASNTTAIKLALTDKTSHEYMLFVHFADFQKSQLRQFNVSFSDGEPLQYSPQYLTAGTLGSTDWYMASDGVYSITLAPTVASNLPPMLNALEMYTRISHTNPMTFPKDCKYSLMFNYSCVLIFSTNSSLMFRRHVNNGNISYA